MDKTICTIPCIVLPLVTFRMPTTKPATAIPVLMHMIGSKASAHRMYPVATRFFEAASFLLKVSGSFCICKRGGDPNHSTIPSLFWSPWLSLRPFLSDHQRRGKASCFGWLIFETMDPMPSKKPVPCHLRDRFGSNVAGMRQGVGLTQEQMAEKCGLSTRYWQSLEAGEYFPPLATLTRIKSILACSWEDLFDGCG